MAAHRASGGDMLGVTAIRPVERKGMEALNWFLYDPTTGAIMGRTPRSWLLITIFYIVYYSCLALFWGLCFFIFYKTTIDLDTPRWQQEDSLIGNETSQDVQL